MDQKEFDKLFKACMELSAFFPDGVVFIGGIAVYIHAINMEATRSFAEFTHDADFYISLADMGDLRDLEEVTPNRRLSKHQLIKNGFEFDIYTERHSALIVPYDQVVAHASTYDAMKVASLEHLLVLKLEAYRDRHASTKGQKDAKDIIRIALVARARNAPLRTELVVPYLRDEHSKLLDRVQRGPEFLSMTRGNAKQAKDLRREFEQSIAGLLE